MAAALARQSPLAATMAKQVGRRETDKEVAVLPSEDFRNLGRIWAIFCPLAADMLDQNGRYTVMSASCPHLAFDKMLLRDDKYEN
jgi:hypothetical protein